MMFSIAIPSNIHASCIALGEDGLLIEGPSGSGKSRLAARLMAGWAHGSARLVADDRTLLFCYGDAVIARPHAAIAGKLEWRGVGILPLLSLEAVRVRAVVRLGQKSARMPLAEDRQTMHLGVPLPILMVENADAAYDTLTSTAPFWRLELCTSVSGRDDTTTDIPLEKMVHRTIKNGLKATASSPVPR